MCLGKVRDLRELQWAVATYTEVKLSLGWVWIRKVFTLGPA